MLPDLRDKGLYFNRRAQYSVAQAQTASAGDTGGLLTTATYKEVALATLSNIIVGSEFNSQIKRFAEQLAKHGSSPHTVRNYESHVARFLQSIEPLNLESVDRDIVRGYLNAKYPADTQASSRFMALAALKSFFRFTLSDGRIPPTEGIPRFRTRRPMEASLTEYQVQQLLDQAPNVTIQHGRRRRRVYVDHRNVAILELLYASGLHVNELRRMDVIDIALEVRLARVPETRGRKRIVPFGRPCAEALRRHLASMKEHTGPLFTNTRGGRLGEKAIGTIVRRYGQKVLGINTVHPRSLRSACAVHLLENFMPPIYIQHLLGLKNIQATERYLHRATARLQAQLRYHPRSGAPAEPEPIGESTRPWVAQIARSGLAEIHE